MPGGSCFHPNRCEEKTITMVQVSPCDEFADALQWMSCFMTMIDYYLLGARVSFCVCKNSCHVVQKLPCCLSGSSLSSDIATQVTCIVIAQCSSKFSSSDVVTCFLLPGGLVFSFYLHHTISGVHRVWPKQWLKKSSHKWSS